MRQQSSFFVGFAKLEDLLEQACGTKLYVNALSKTEAGKPPLVLENHFVMVASLDETHCYYWKLETGNNYRYDTESQKAVRERTLAAFDLIKGIVADHHFTPMEANVAVPSNLTLTSGYSSLIRFDKQTDRYVLRQREEVSS